jgi:hypothetical protein
MHAYMTESLLKLSQRKAIEQLFAACAWGVAVFECDKCEAGVEHRRFQQVSTRNKTQTPHPLSEQAQVHAMTSTGAPRHLPYTSTQTGQHSNAPQSARNAYCVTWPRRTSVGSMGKPHGFGDSLDQIASPPLSSLFALCRVKSACVRCGPPQTSSSGLQNMPGTAGGIPQHPRFGYV